MKKIRLQFFAFFRERMGVDQMEVPIEDGDTIEDLYFWLRKNYPETAFPLPSLRFAVNGEYVGKTAFINDNDEVVLVPPVAGG